MGQLSKAATVRPPDDEPPGDAPPDKSQKAAAASKWGQERRERRREWEDVEPKEFDQRHTRKAKFKLKKVELYITPETHAACEAWRARMGYGRGMSWGEFFEYLFARAAKPARREWAERQEEGPE